MAELVLVVFAALVAATFVLAPLWRSAEPPTGGRTSPDAARYQAALEALRDLEADRRSGLLDEATYAAERPAAERRAADALRATESATPAPRPPGRAGAGRRAGVVIALVIGALLVTGSALPGPVGLAGRIVVDEQLAAARAAEQARQARIDDLRARLAEDARDTETLSELADAYLAGTSREDLSLGATVLLVLIGLDPADEDAYRRLITAYLRAGDYANASAAFDGFEPIASDGADVAFFRGLLALRGNGDPATAEREFTRFLELAPDDERAPMVRALRAEAAAEADR